MSIWKKAISVTASAALLASLFASAFVGTVSANAAPQALSGTCNPASCTQVANSGLIVLSGSTNTFPAATAVGGGARKLTVSGAGATFVTTAGAHFTLESATVTGGTGEFYLAGEVAVATGVALVAADTVSVVGATAGTATVTEWLWTGSGGSPANTWLPDGNTWALTITASTSAYQVSAAASTVTTGTAAGCATAQTSAAASGGAAFACVTVMNLAPTPAAIVGASVTVTIQPFGLVMGAQTATLTTGAGGVASFAIAGSGLAGVSTISASATWLGVTTALTPASFTWTGTPNTLKLAAKAFTNPYLSAATVDNAFFVQATDAAGNSLPQAGATLTSSPAGLLDLGIAGSTGAGYYHARCPDATTKTVYTVTATIAAPALTSNTVKFVCNPGIASTLKVTVSSPSIPAGGSTAFTVTGTDATGNPISDGTVISAVASAGVAIGSSTVNTSKTLNGVATFTYVAVNNNGPVTLTAVEFANSGLTATGTVGVGQPPAASGSAASALGVTTSGPFSKSTKLPARGHYVTIKFSGLTAGGTVVIQVATKSGSSWSAFVNKTSRIADSGGNVYFYWKSSTAAWLSIRAVGTNAVQVRWR